MLSATVRDQVFEFLVPYMNDKAEREGLVTGALYDCKVLGDITWTGSSNTFTAHLIEKLTRFGSCSINEPEPSLNTLLRTIRTDRAGTDKHVFIDELISAIEEASRPVETLKLITPKIMVETSHYLFISYAHAPRDMEVARSLEKMLMEVGYRVFRDEKDIGHDQKWDQIIHQALKETDRMILLMSDTSMPFRQEVYNEWHYYLGEKKPIYPLLLEDCERPYRLKPFNYIDARESFQQAVDKLVHQLQQQFIPPAETFDDDEIIIDVPDSTPVNDHTPLEIITNTLKVACEKASPLVLSNSQIQSVIAYKPKNWREYCASRIVEWSQADYRLDNQFVNLTLLIDKGREQKEQFEAVPERFHDIREVLEKQPDDFAFVVMGDPGGGKSTILRRLQLDICREQICKNQEQYSFFVTLNQYTVDRNGEWPDPLEWLVEQWQDEFPHLPTLEESFRSGKVTLLLDGLNEIPHRNSDEYAERIEAWGAFLQKLRKIHRNNRAIFSCRTNDYSRSLSSGDVVVPHINVQAMDDTQIQKFLRCYMPERAEEIWGELKDSKQKEIFQTPYFLKLLVDQIGKTDHIPQGRASLFTGFVRSTLKREAILRKNRLLQPDGLLDEDDYAQINLNDWLDSWELPEGGCLMAKLAQLAYQMQETASGMEMQQVRIRDRNAYKLISHPQHRDIVSAAISLNILDKRSREILFFHQLLQEFFAARELAENPKPELVKSEWHVDQVTPKLEAAIAELADSDPLPQLPTTGWEETTVLASAMAKSPEEFIRGLMDSNLALAARCASQAEVTISATMKKDLQEALLERMGNEEADLRARIACGLALGNLGDPRLERKTGKYGDYLLPQWVEIEGGEYPIGVDESDYDREKPAHTVLINPFKIAKYPVTNAEYALFIKAGGYEDEQWWDTDAGKAWRAGDTAEGPKANLRGLRGQLQGIPDSQIRSFPGRTQDELNSFIAIKNMDDRDFEDLLDEWYPGGRQTQPEYWNDNRFNNLAQPVVGISWHEARAYCKWLSAQTGQEIDLPTEAEWEASARGKAGRLYPYAGEFDSLKSNTFESHIRETTPIGIYAGGVTPETKIYDLIGNVYEWTLSIYDQEKFRYPYQEDGRNNIDADSTDLRRVLRGGSWRFNHFSARAVYRNLNDPADRLDFLCGFRLILRPPSSAH